MRAEKDLENMRSGSRILSRRPRKTNNLAMGLKITIDEFHPPSVF
jgi:hypothetical protein